jgi:hypothetical protein
MKFIFACFHCTMYRLTVASLFCSTSTKTLLKILSVHCWKNIRIINMILLDNSRLNIIFLLRGLLFTILKNQMKYTAKKREPYSVTLLPFLLKTADHKHGLFDNFGSFLSRSDLLLPLWHSLIFQGNSPVHMSTYTPD